ncbi:MULTISPECIES: DUF2934 domain-containing protein [unclassified Sinorhizobium]|uniref:DUF2934 domain-containing protein n=1 Tax=unclassified Sinorhizobium TaxID=2613772 RepID=UPI003523AAF0
MDNIKEEWIGRRAYALWEAEGRPEGRSGEHWRQATEEYERRERTKASPDGSELIAALKAAGRQMKARGAAADQTPGPRKSATRV